MDIEIFPHRILGADTAEKLLNEVEALDDVQRTVIHGPRFPDKDATLPPQYRERRVLNILGEKVVLQVKPSRIFVEITLESTIDKIDEICKEHLPFGYEINQSRRNYIRKNKTVTDRIKYGDALPDDLVGMTDQYSKFDKHVSILKKE